MQMAFWEVEEFVRFESPQPGHMTILLNHDRRFAQVLITGGAKEAEQEEDNPFFGISIIAEGKFKRTVR